ncbi:MAG: peptidylprolyl isomerase [Actinomycetota bacterium]
MILRFVALPLALLAAAGGVVVAGGYPTSMSEAATITYTTTDGERTVHVERDRFETELALVASVPPFVESRAADGTVSTEITAGWMELAITQAVIDAEFDARGLSIDDTSAARGRRAAARALLTLLESDDVWPGLELLGALDDRVGSELIEAQRRQLALVDAVGPTGEVETPRPTEVAAFVEGNPELIDACPTGRYAETVVTATRAQAQTVLDEVVAGDDFSELAADYGGGAGCVPEPDPDLGADELLDAARNEPLGEVIGPIEAQGQDGSVQFFLLQTSDFATAQLLQQLRAEAANEQAGAVNEVFGPIFETLTVRMDPRYGSRVEGGIEAPRAPTPRSQREPDRAVDETTGLFGG